MQSRVNEIIKKEVSGCELRDDKASGCEFHVSS
jgi:hypothetical protein